MLQTHIKFFVSWLLTVVMFYHIVGYAFLFSTTDLIHRSSMKETLNKNTLSFLKISNRKIKHHPEIFMRLNDDEIFYDGNYYDVKSETSGNGFTCFEVIKDARENNWHQQLSEAQSNSNSTDGKTIKSGTKIFSPEWFSVFQFQFVERNSLQYFSFYGDKNISSVCDEVFLPPPQV